MYIFLSKFPRWFWYGYIIHLLILSHLKINIRYHILPPKCWSMHFPRVRTFSYIMWYDGYFFLGELLLPKGIKGQDFEKSDHGSSQNTSMSSIFQNCAMEVKVLFLLMIKWLWPYFYFKVTFNRILWYPCQQNNKIILLNLFDIFISKAIKLVDLPVKYLNS